MKVQTKIALLLGLVMAIFLGGLGAFRTYDQIKFRKIAEERFAERHRSFQDFLNEDGEPLQTFALDDSASDPLVDAITRTDLAWLAQNASVARLESFGANALWIYRPGGQLLYRVNNLTAGNLEDLPMPPDAFAGVFASEHFAHFFITVPQGLMEIRGAVIHGSRDFDRKEPGHGYLFVGRLWSKPVLDEMSLFTGNSVSLEDKRENYNDEFGLLAFSQPLRGWNGQPVKHLVVRNQSPVVQELRRSSQRLLLWLVVFALALVLVLLVLLVLWVRRPLRHIMASLAQNDPKPLAHLVRDPSEFGEMARTVQKFFEQRDTLLREMEERRVAEEALRKSEDELRHSQKMEAVGRLAGGIAHDFNNLLTAIIGYAELINTQQAPNSLVRQQADLIHKAGEQASALTRQLLAFSRKQLLQPRVIDLNHLVAEMENLLRRVIGERFNLSTRAEASLGTVLADPNQLEQVIINLGVNARDAMPTGGDLLIRTATIHLDTEAVARISGSLRAGDYVELSVADTGSGMDPETQSRIFEPFFTTKAPGKGTGLGLATVYGIVNQSGGGIAVESEIGKGTTFRIYLPLERSSVSQSRNPTLPPVDRTHNFETILVVEDEEIVRDLVCAVLTDEGYNVLCAPDGQQALAMANALDGPIHLLITDVIMPGMNGPELAERLGSARGEMKILYVSGYSDNDLGHQGVLDHRVDLLQKPFTPQVLARKIRDVMQGQRHAENSWV